MSTKVKILAAAIAIFLAGGVAGGIVGAIHERGAMMSSLDQSQISQRIRSRLTGHYGLSQDQIARVAPIIEETASKLDTENQESARKIWFIFSDFHARIASPAGLTEQQKDMFAQSEREHMLKLKPTPTPAH